MYQVMIIDDEMIVREGIRNLIPWEDYNFEICQEGIDGKDGLKKVLDYAPDLVLVDVKMPGLSGIELIREAKKSGFEGKFIILTGYSDFEFAKSAISLGVRAYLLKPIDEDELIENVKEVVAELDAKKNLDDYYTLSELKARQEVLYRLLLYSEDKESLRKEIKLYGMDFKYHNFCVAVLKYKEGYADNSLNQDKIDGMLKEITQVDKVTVDEKLVFICKGQGYEDILQILLKNNDRIKKRFGEGFFITVGHNVANWEDIHFSYECARLLSEYEFLFKDKDGVGIEVLNNCTIREADNFYERLLSYIEIGDTNNINSAVSEMKDFFRGRLLKEWEIKVQLVHNMSILYSMLEKRYELSKETVQSYKTFTEGIKEAYSLNGLMELVLEFCMESAGRLSLSLAENVAKRMVAYMEKNYAQDLKLEGMAKLFNYNSAYLGKIFKKEIGENFNNILDSIRIKNAKRLLQETDLKVYQISEQVGYGNIDYFYSKFKKYVGISPKEFKQS
ncbi:MAG: two component transcriptional regulator, AraC family [Anaerocolumna sp.]|jgi:two-component system response regulator YesN|nr:two component transcriptional regulator, AraC family [Anaerocolumna sp.]